jgi:hypothetical protein
MTVTDLEDANSIVLHCLRSAWPNWINAITLPQMKHEGVTPAANNMHKTYPTRASWIPAHREQNENFYTHH